MFCTFCSVSQATVTGEGLEKIFVALLLVTCQQTEVQIRCLLRDPTFPIRTLLASNHLHSVFHNGQSSSLDARVFLSQHVRH